MASSMSKSKEDQAGKSTCARWSSEEMGVDASGGEMEEYYARTYKYWTSISR